MTAERFFNFNYTEAINNKTDPLPLFILLFLL